MVTETEQADQPSDGSSDAASHGSAPASDGPTQDGRDVSENVEASGSPAALDPLAEAERRAAQLKEQLMRTAADFDNFRKRARREAEDARHSGRESMLKELLPVFDNLERAVAASGSAVDVESFASGIEMVTRQFQDTLSRVGIERIVSVGQAFDPALHEAIQHLESADAEPGSVVAEVQGGYRSGQRLIRPAMVVVAKAPASTPSVDG